MLLPSASRARRSRTLLRIASAPTRSAGSTISEKPNRSFRWKVTPLTYRENGRSLELVDRPQRAIGGDPRASVAHPRLDQRVTRRGDRALGVGGLDRPGHARLEALLRLGQLQLGQAEPLVGDRHLLLGGRQVEHGLARLGLHLVAKVPLADRLDVDLHGLFLGPALTPEAIQDRHVEEDL